MFITDCLIHLYRQNRFARAVKSKLCMTSKVSGDIMNKVGKASPWARHEHAPLMIGGWLSSTRSQSAKSHPVDGQTKNQFCHCVICIHLRYFGKRACLKPTTCTMRSDAQQQCTEHWTLLFCILLHLSTTSEALSAFQILQMWHPFCQITPHPQPHDPPCVLCHWLMWSNFSHLPQGLQVQEVRTWNIWSCKE